MKDLVEYIVKQIVTNPDAVIVDEQVGGDGSVNLTLTVSPDDMGLVIGKGGQTIKSIRKLLIVRAMGENKRVNLSLYEPEGSRPKTESQASEEAPEETEPTSEVTEEVTKSTEIVEESNPEEDPQKE